MLKELSASGVLHYTTYGVSPRFRSLRLIISKEALTHENP
jgi:hypothetical protein